jgi:hypothetical protein
MAAFGSPWATECGNGVLGGGNYVLTIYGFDGTESWRVAKLRGHPNRR